jgi:antitoxin HicB
VKYVYRANIIEDKGGRFLVTFPDVPEALTDGESEDEALTNASDALAAALAGYVIQNRDIPAPLSRDGKFLVAVPLVTAAKLSLYQGMRKKGVRKTDLARLLNLTEGAVRRLLDPDHSSKIEKLETALAAVGRKLIVEEISDTYADLEFRQWDVFSINPQSLLMSIVHGTEKLAVDTSTTCWAEGQLQAISPPPAQQLYH